jgi:hypothetical protein
MTANGPAHQFDCSVTNGRCRRNLVIAGRAGEGPFTKTTAVAQAQRREPFLMPRCRHSFGPHRPGLEQHRLHRTRTRMDVLLNRVLR